MGRPRTSWPGRAGALGPVLAVGAVVLLVAVLLVAVLRAAADPVPRRAVPTGSPVPSGPAEGGRTSPTRSEPAAPRPVTLAFAGDVHFTGRTEPLLANPATAFGPIADTLAAADLAMVNLETAITERGVEEPKQFHFRAPAGTLGVLAAAGIDVASMANNHAVDYGPVGLQDTLDAVSRSPVAVVGVGRDEAAAYAPFRTVIAGTPISIFAASQIEDHTFQAWSATDSGPGIASTADRARLLAGVRAAAATDVVVVYLHWGVEGDPCPTALMQQLAADLAAAGADAIVGTHAHLMLGAGWLGSSADAHGAYVAYGLGNFLWWRPQASSDDTGVLTLTIQGGHVVSADLTPALIDDAGRPQPVTGQSQAVRRGDFARLRDCTGLRAQP